MINQTIFQSVNNLAGRWAWIDYVGAFCADPLGWILIAILIFFFFFRKSVISRRGIIISIISAIVARFGFTALIRLWYHSPRPFDVIEVRQLIPEGGWSFPSGHAGFYFALAMGIYLYNKKLGWIYFAGAAIVGIARVFAGIHWPADIFGGAGLGILTAMLIDWLIILFSQKKRKKSLPL